MNTTLLLPERYLYMTVNQETGEEMEANCIMQYFNIRNEGIPQIQRIYTPISALMEIYTLILAFRRNLHSNFKHSGYIKELSNIHQP